MQQKEVQKLTKEQQEFAVENIGLVYHFMNTHNIDAEIHEGNMIVKYLNCVMKYDSSVGEFSTYLYNALKHYMGWYNKHMQYKDRYMENLNGSMEEEIMNINGDGTKLTLHDVIPDKKAEFTGGVEYSDSIAKFIDKLNPRERQIFEMRCKDYTLQEIGNEVGITRERVRQIIERKIKPKLLRAKIVKKRKDGCYILGNC